MTKPVAIRRQLSPQKRDSFALADGPNIFLKGARAAPPRQASARPESPSASRSRPQVPLTIFCSCVIGGVLTERRGLALRNPPNSAPCPGSRFGPMTPMSDQIQTIHMSIFTSTVFISSQQDCGQSPRPHISLDWRPLRRDRSGCNLK